MLKIYINEQYFGKWEYLFLWIVKKKKNEKQWNIYEASAKTYENKKYNFFSLKNQIEETEWTVCVSSYRNHAIN